MNDQAWVELEIDEFDEFHVQFGLYSGAILSISN